MQLTDEQRAAVEASGDRVAVVAGAGTGKTRVLTARYLHLIRAKVSPRAILALTFTEKAAREMRTRIQETLELEGMHHEVRESEFAPISTVHSFLARILRERALDVGLDPRFAVADELTAETYLEQSLRETVDGLEPEDRDRLSRVVSVEEFLRGLYLAARATPLEMSDLRPAEFDLEALRVEMRRFLETARATEANGKTGEKLDGLRAGAERFLALDPDAVAEFGELVSRGVAPACKSLFDEGKRLKAEYEHVPWIEPAREYGAAIVRAVVDLDQRYAARKEADGLLDFSDLEREGYRLLRSEAAPSIRSAYRHILVDEYQDTSRIQEAILDELAKGPHLFGVGDEKQSIYRFRYADAAIFADLQNQAECHRLSGSFRSRPEVVSFNNDVFRELFSGTPMAEQTLRAAKPSTEVDGPCVEIVAGAAERASEAVRMEAAAFATRLRELVDAEAFEYRDAALLVRATTHLTTYERAFAQAEIPYVVVKGRGYYAAREVVDLAHLLLLLEDPSDDYCAASALTSLFCGVPESDLLHLRAAHPMPVRARHQERPAEIPTERWERLVRFADRFVRWRELAGRIELGELVETILRETKCDVLMLSLPDGRRRYANLHKALRRARRHVESPAHYARALLEFREREQRESEAPIASATDNAVQIMTVHASKGLEFPLVMVGGLAGERVQPPTVVLRASGEFRFSIKAPDGNRVAPGGVALNEWNKAEETRERKRLWYVAFTRAERHLLLGCVRYEKRPPEILAPLERFGHVLAEPTNGWKIPRAGGGGVRARTVRAAVRRAADLPAELKRDDDAAGELLARLDGMARRQPNRAPYVVAVADLVEFERCPRRYRLKRMLGIEFDPLADDEPWRDIRGGDDEFPRRELGTVFHELMAECGPFGVPTREQIDLHLPDASDAVVAKLVGWAEWTRAQPLVQTLEPEACRKEMPFLAKLGRWAVRGVIDLYCERPAVLLDYKTGATVRADAYATQVAIYLAALRAMGLPAPDRAHLLYVDADEVVEVPDRPLDDLLHDFADAHTRRFIPKPGPVCSHCEFRAACLADGVACPD